MVEDPHRKNHPLDHDPGSNTQISYKKNQRLLEHGLLTCNSKELNNNLRFSQNVRYGLAFKVNLLSCPNKSSVHCIFQITENLNRVLKERDQDCYAINSNFNCPILYKSFAERIGYKIV